VVAVAVTVVVVVAVDEDEVELGVDGVLALLLEFSVGAGVEWEAGGTVEWLGGADGCDALELDCAAPPLLVSA
jgi:hypothetical protein